MSGENVEEIKEIETKRLNIIPASNQQMECIIAEQSVPELKEAFSQMYGACLAHPKLRKWYVLWLMKLNHGDREEVGSLSFKGIDVNGVVEIGYGTHPGYEGQGYMTEAVTAVVRWAAKQDGVNSIEAETEEDNIASKRVLEKAGFMLNGKMGDEGPRYTWKSF